ncbi:PilN family type IVB pilus formation outer membrane protein [Trinickia acidisoli]|uniref:PilN family type IVB pilus formation outer membrane protein n=1 Tax=Trinickia acidisoli TaxID=2767482 RepID=UPI001F5D21D1|nr:PilN family type IVB pilus formation outer membrane protein [Trinickia acidisoli]
MNAGCTGLTQRIADATSHDTDQGHALVADSEKGHIAVHALDDVVVNNGIWLSGRTVKLGTAAALPAIFAQPATFDRSVSSLQEFAERVTRLTQLPTKVAPDASAAAERTLEGVAGGDTRAGAAAGNAIGAVTVKPPLPPTRGGSLSTSIAPVPLHIVYSNGDLKGLLDSACAEFGVYWKFANGVVDFYFTDTRTFQVSAVPGDSAVKANVVSAANNDNGNGTNGGTSGATGSTGGTSGTSGTGVSSDNTSTTQVNSQLSIFGSLDAAIKAMLSPYGQVVSSPATGSISVTDTPDALDRVAHFMEEQNRVMARQVMINVTVLTVTLTDSDSYGIDWTAVYQALGTRFGLTNTFAPTVTNPVSFSAAVLTPSSRANGTSAMISALSEQGKVRRKTSASVTTLNNQPVPVQVATQQGYLASISTTNTANVGSQTSLTPGTVTTGFNMTLLPHVLDDGTVMMQFYTNLSSLVTLQSVSSGGSNPLQIQTPEIDTRNFLQRVAMKSGSTLVISGYEGTNDNLTQQGVGKPQNYLAGGGFEATRSRDIIVILITPITMSSAGA